MPKGTFVDMIEGFVESVEERRSDRYQMALQDLNADLESFPYQAAFDTPTGRHYSSTLKRVPVFPLGEMYSVTVGEIDMTPMLYVGNDRDLYVYGPMKTTEYSFFDDSDRDVMLETTIRLHPVKLSKASSYELRLYSELLRKVGI